MYMPRPTLTQAVMTVALLREAADYIERNGQYVIASGDFSVSIDNDLKEFVDGGGRVIGHMVGDRTIAITSDLVMRSDMPYAPRVGIKPFRIARKDYRWDGEPPRPPKKGELYVRWSQAEVKTATRDLKKAQYIVIPA